MYKSIFIAVKWVGARLRNGRVVAGTSPYTVHTHPGASPPASKEHDQPSWLYPPYIVIVHTILQLLCCLGVTWSAYQMLDTHDTSASNSSAHTHLMPCGGVRHRHEITAACAHYYPSDTVIFDTSLKEASQYSISKSHENIQQMVYAGRSVLSRIWSDKTYDIVSRAPSRFQRSPSQT